MHVNPKAAMAIVPISKTNGATASGYVDTKGWDYLSLAVISSTADAVSNKPSVLKLQEADVTNASSFADISGAVGGTDFTIPNAETTAANPVVLFNVDLRARKRYIQAVVSPVTTQVIGAVGMLTQGEVAATDATKAGVGAVVSI